MLAGLSARRLTSVSFSRRPCGPSPGLGAPDPSINILAKGHPSNKSQAPSCCPHFFLNPSPRCLSAVLPLLKAQAPHAHVFSASLLVLRLSFTDFPPGHDRRHDIEPVFLTLLAHANDDRKVTGRDAVDRYGFCRWTSTCRSGIPFGNSQEIFRKSGTDGSSLVPSSGESANYRFLSRTTRVVRLGASYLCISVFRGR